MVTGGVTPDYISSWDSFGNNCHTMEDALFPPLPFSVHLYIFVLHAEDKW
ncbi:unnamed protein product [Eretmochelys imbricata]